MEDLLIRIKPEIQSRQMKIENETISNITYKEVNNYNYAIVEFSDTNGKSSNVILTNFNLGMNDKSCSDCDCYAVTCTGQQCYRVPYDNL